MANAAVGELGEDADKARLLNSNVVDIFRDQVRITNLGDGSHRVADFLVRGKKRAR